MLEIFLLNPFSYVFYSRGFYFAQTQKLREILEAFCIHNPSIGYCQGMNFVMATCLLVMQPEDAFWYRISYPSQEYPTSCSSQNVFPIFSAGWQFFSRNNALAGKT